MEKIVDFFDQAPRPADVRLLSDGAAALAVRADAQYAGLGSATSSSLRTFSYITDMIEYMDTAVGNLMAELRKRQA